MSLTTVRSSRSTSRSKEYCASWKEAESSQGRAERDHDKVAQSLVVVARKIQAAEERQRLLLDLYASGAPPRSGVRGRERVLDKELHALKLKKAEFVQGLPLLHKESVELSIRQFCEIALARFEHCIVFDDKRQFLVEHVESIIYDRYRLTVIGSVPIKMQLSNSQEIETRKLAFCLRGEIDKTTLHKKPRQTFA